MDYNPKKKESIYKYAKKLIGKSFNDICDEDNHFLKAPIKETSGENYKFNHENKSRKGGLGELIEERYFHYKADNEARADFPDAKVELKVTPYKINKNGTISAKERLIISMINYFDIINMEFFDSNVWEKAQNILLVYYLWSSKIENRLDYIINFVYMFSPEGEDLEIIKNDYYKIKQKIIDGKAHELSESDTLYLGAATKASTSKDRREQPYSDIPAKPRAFSLKQSYMTYVLRNYVILDSKKEDKIIKDKKVYGFEQYVLDKIDKYKNNKDKNLFVEFFGTYNTKAKDKYTRLAFEILGVKTKNAEEFEKANIVVKSLRVEENNKIIESISFPSFKIMEIVKQDWEDSDVNKYFNETRFLFIIYKKQGDSYDLKGAKFWNMPISEIDGKLNEEWTRARDTFIQGVKFEIDEKKTRIYNNLPKKSNTRILHVRPHAQKAAYLINGKEYGNGVLKRDSDILPDGNRMTKQCFWLNNDYVLKQIEDKLD